MTVYCLLKSSLIWDSSSVYVLQDLDAFEEYWLVICNVSFNLGWSGFFFHGYVEVMCCWQEYYSQAVEPITAHLIRKSVMMM